MRISSTVCADQMWWAAYSTTRRPLLLRAMRAAAGSSTTRTHIKKRKQESALAVHEATHTDPYPFLDTKIHYQGPHGKFSKGSQRALTTTRQ